MSTTGERLKKIRESKRYSLRKLAEVSGVNFKTIHRIEKEEGGTSADTLYRLALALEVPLTDIMGLSDNNTEEGDVTVGSVRISEILRILEDLTQRPLDENTKKSVKYALLHYADKLDQ